MATGAGEPAMASGARTSIWKTADSAVRPAASATRTWMPWKTPATVGVPETVPVAPSRTMPSGSMPAATDHA